MNKKILVPTVVAVALLAVRPGRTQVPSAADANQTAASATLNQYCLGCHSAAVKSGGVVIDPKAVGQAGANAETWEKVVKMLRAESMPPPGAPRPKHETYVQTASFLEGRLDQAATAKPNVGDLPQLHRLTRTEYENAIRDLVGLENLPEEMDYRVLLPADNSSSGFDNIADLLFVSPAVMERYLDAARKISRLAVGDPKLPVMVNIHAMAVQHPQNERVEELPMGTRGGLAIDTYFPLDATYVIKVEQTGNSREPHQLEISLDGERKELIAPAAGGGRGGGRGGRGGAAQPDTRIQVKAGPHQIGVTYVEKTEALDEAVVKPRTRSRGSQPAVGKVTISGPYDVTGPGDTPARRKIFSCTTQDAACAKQVISNLMRRAYRRPVTDEDVADIMPFFDAGKKERDFDLGIEKALERVLISPQFLYRIERDNPSVGIGVAYPVTDLELASRVSFFLWSSIPDDELLNAATSGQLRQRAGLEKQVKRMLADPRSETMVTNFAAQWLFLRDVETKDADLFLFRDFDEVLRSDLERETELFLDSVLRENRPVTELLSANYTFLNERLAKHYEIPNIQGSYFRKVTFPPGSPRGGLLGQGSILTITSKTTRTSPVVRGKYVLDNLLASPPPPPPPNVPSLKTEGATSDEPLSMREAMTLHRASPACAGCHAKMDPIGFSLENFDAVGRWRELDGAGKPIDAATQLVDGTKFTGVAGLKQLLLKDPERFVDATTQKLMMYAIGRNVQYYDAPSVRAIVRAAAPQNYTFESLVLGVVESRPFQMRANPPVRN